MTLHIAKSTHNIPGTTESDVIVAFLDSSLVSTALGNFKDESFSIVKVIDHLPSEDVISHIFRILKPTGKVSYDGKGLYTRESAQNLSEELKINGFVDIIVAKDTESNERFITCQKPSWRLGSSVTLKTSSQPAEKTTPWKLNVADITEDDLIDEDELIQEANKFTSSSAISGCDGEVNEENGKKRACKNCSCGFADEEEKAMSLGINAPEKSASSSCGNCYKGDAFRCGSCPYLGLPAFEPGHEKLVLATRSDF